MAGKRRVGLGHYIILIIIAVAVVVYLIPIYWIIITSLKSPSDIVTKVPKFLFRITWENYQKLMPMEVPLILYVFLVEALIGILLVCLSLKKDVAIVQMLIPMGSILFVLTNFYAFISTMNYNFLMLIVYAVVAYWLIRKTTATVTQALLIWGSLAAFALVAVCAVLAGAGSKYFHQLLNSIVIGFGSTILAVGLGTCSAYAFSRFEILGKEDLLFFILSTRMLPPVVVVIPVYLMYSKLGLRDTHLGLILLYTTFNLSFAVWLMKGFIDEIPKEYEDAALVDGYTRFQSFFKVVFPQSVTGMAATAVFCLITAWNEFAFALVLTEVGGKAVTAPPSITSATGSGGMDWGMIAAKTFIFLLPVAVFTFLMRKHLLRGVTFGAIKR